MAFASAAGFGLAGLGLGAGSGSSSEKNTGQNWSLGTSANSSYTNSDSANNAYGYNTSWNNSEGWSNNEAIGEGWSNGYSNSQSENYGHVYGREASAQDIRNAAEANRIQQNMWSENAAYNSKEAELNRQFQAHMSNTAYQRAVADLLTAGLNPILAVGGMGASTPVGSAASSAASSSHKANAHAEQTSGGYSYTNSANNSYNYNKSKGSSYNYANGGSKGENWENGWSKSRSESYGASKNESYGYNIGEAQSNYTNNVREMTEKAVGTVKQLYNTGTQAAKNVTKSLLKDYKDALTKNTFKNPFKSGERLYNSPKKTKNGGTTGHF